MGIGLVCLLYLSALLCTLVHGTVTSGAFLQSCNKFFYRSKPPQGFPANLKYICQRYNNTFYYATLYNTSSRIPLYSAYTLDNLECSGTQPARKNNWFIEPELAGTQWASSMTSDLKSNYNNMAPVQAVNVDYDRTGYDRGHLNPNFFQCDEARTATFTLTNSIPQNPCFNRITWYDAEQDMLDVLRTTCGANFKRLLITGAVPSGLHGKAAKLIPQKDLPADVIQDRATERVNVPSHVWTAVCCDGSLTGSRSFAIGHIAENKAEGALTKFANIRDMSIQLSQLYGYPIVLFEAGCSAILNPVIG